MLKLLRWGGCLLPLAGWAQAPVADSLAPAPPAWRWVSSRLTEAGECHEVLYCDSARGLVRVYYPSGRLKSYTPFLGGEQITSWGVATAWYESGQLLSRQEFLKGQRQSLVVYYPNGALKRRTTYTNDQELVGDCYDPTGQPLAYSLYEQAPLYPGGDAMLESDLLRQLRLSRSEQQWLALVPGIRKIEVRFEVREDGSINNPQVLAIGLPALREALVRALLQLPRRFLPGRRDGEATAFLYRMPVRLPGTGARR